MIRRRDGRVANQLRPISVEFGLLHNVDGSARLTVGDTRILVGVHGPRPARSLRVEDPERAVLEVNVTAASGLPGPREALIASSLRSALLPLIHTAAHPRTVITIAVVVQADGGSALATTLNAAVLACVDAGIPLLSLPAAVSLGYLRPAAAAAASSASATASAAAAVDDSAFDGSVEGAQLCLDLYLSEESGAGAAQAAATVAFTSQTIASAGAGAGAGAEAEESEGAPCLMHLTGAIQPALLPAMLTAGRAAAATMLAFLRVALKHKVSRDAVNAAPVLHVPLAAVPGLVLQQAAAAAPAAATAAATAVR